MLRTLLYIVLLGALGYGVYYFLFSNRENGFTIGETGFQVKDTSNIGKVFLSEMNGQSILLERTDSGWVVNKHFKALKSMTRLLLNTMAKQEVQAPVSEGAHNHVVSAIAGNGIKVEIYDRQGKKNRVFYVGSESYNFNGSYMLMEGATRPYVVNIPGFQGYLSTRYSTKLSDWKDRTVFDIAPQDIKSISVQYPEHPLNSFVLNQDNGKVTMTGDPNIVHNDALNKRKASVYLKYFTNLNSEGFVNGAEDIAATLASTKMFSVIDVTANNGRHQHADIYWMPLNKRSKNITVHAPDIPDDYDADRFFAVTNNYRDTIMIQRYVFGKLFRGAYEFFQKDDSTNMGPQNYVQPKNVMMHKNVP